MSRRKVIPEMVEMMSYMKREGESVTEIADKLDLSRRTVLKHLKKHERTEEVMERMKEIGWRD